MLLSNNRSATVTKMNLISAGFKAQTGNAYAGKGSQQDAPDPGGCSKLAAQSCHGDCSTLGTPYFDGVVGSTGI